MREEQQHVGAESLGVFRCGGGAVLVPVVGWR